MIRDEKSTTIFGGVCRVIISDWQHTSLCKPLSELQPLWYKGDVKTNWWEFEAEHSFPLSSLHAYPPPNIWRGWKSCYIRSLLNIELVNGLYWFIYASLTWCWQQQSDECSIKSMWKKKGYNFLFMSVRLWFSRYWMVKLILYVGHGSVLY